MRRRRALTVLLGAAALLAGCRAAATPPPVESIPTFAPLPVTAAAPSEAPTPQPETTVEAVFPTAAGPDPIEQAVLTLSDTLGVAAEGISLVEAVPVQWNNSSLGCPEPDGSYLDVVTPGYLVTLAVGEESYSVHTDLGATAVVCLGEDDPIGPGTVLDPIAAEFIAQARADLAERAGQPAGALVLVRSDAVEWADSRLGCAAPEGDEVVEGVTPGYRIVLAAADVHYEYHTDQQRIIFCEEPIE